jgi:serine/threonine protein kinase
MDRSAAKAMRPDAVIFRDGFGERLLVRDAKGRPLHETLVLRSELTGVPSFEFSLNQRLTELDTFEHHAFVTVRQLVRVPGGVPRVSLVADHLVGGVRLSDVLARCNTSNNPLSTGTVLFLIKEILDAISVLHRQNPDVSHGALSPERILIADGKVRITDYVLGSAVEQLRFTPDRYWRELRVAVPSSAGGLRFDRRVDVAQIGMIAVALLASRPLGDAENISGLGELLMCLTQTTDHGPRILSVPLRSWLMKALHLDLRRTFVTPWEAEQALQEAMGEAGVRATPNELEMASMQPRRSGSLLTVKTNIPKAPLPSAPAAPPSIAAPPPVIAAPPPPPALQQRPAVQTMAPEIQEPEESAFAPVTNLLLSARAKNLFKFGVVAVLMAAAFTAAQYIPPPAKLFSTTGTLVVESKPEGVQVFVDGQLQGVTPMTLTVSAGMHKVELRYGTPRVFNVYVTRGDRVSQYIELPIRARRPAAPPPPPRPAPSVDDTTPTAETTQPTP